LLPDFQAYFPNRLSAKTFTPFFRVSLLFVSLWSKYPTGYFPNIKHLTLRGSSPANRQFNDAEMIKDWKRLLEK